MKRIRVGVRFCGHCNPLVECESIVESAEAIGKEIEFVHWSNPDKDVLLTISGCSVNCVEKPEFRGTIVEVAGSSVNGKILSVQEIASAIVSTIRSRLQPIESAEEGRADRGR